MANRKAADKLNPGLYVIADNTKAKVYLGSTVDISSRFRNHLSDLRNDRHHNEGLQQAFNNGHNLTVVFVPTQEQVDVRELEQELLNEFHPTGVMYNTSVNALSGMAGRKHTDEALARMRDAKIGKPLAEEHRLKISERNKGRKHSPETIELLKAGSVGRGLGRTLSPETIEKIRAASTGRKHTQEAKDKMSAASLGIAKSPEHAAKTRQLLASYVSEKSIPVTINGVDYPSTLAASNATGISYSTLRRRLAQNGGKNE